jgi:hypothetical protein
MKRDMDLCRKILFEVEKAPYKIGWIDIKFDEYSKEEVAYHVMLLEEAGLIDAIDVSKGANDWRPKRLSWEGHEFLDAARDDTRWEKAKGAMALVGGFVFDVGKQLLIQYLKQELNLI